MKRIHQLLLGVATTLCLVTTAGAAPGPKPLAPISKPAGGGSAPAANVELDIATIEKLLLDGTPGDWKFITAKTGAYKSGTKVRMGSDYSGHCLTYKSQEVGINLGHWSDCNKTAGGENITFEKDGGGTIEFGDVVRVKVSQGSSEQYVCYGVRDGGIDLNWGKTSDECKKRDGSKGKDAAQWKLLPPAGSAKKNGDPVEMTDRFALHNLVAEDALVKCARIYGPHVPPTWWAGDLKWRGTCKHHELIWTHRELLQKLGKDPKKLALQFVPKELRAALEKML